MGSSKIRNTSEILDTTRRVFDILSWEYKNQVIHLPKLPFQIKVTAADEGAIFDIQKGGNPVVVNVCCFAEANKRQMFAYVDSLSGMYKKIFGKIDILEPVTPNWIYSVIINPAGLSPTDMATAGEVELYIYEQLYFAWKNYN